MSNFHTDALHSPALLRVTDPTTGTEHIVGQLTNITLTTDPTRESGRTCGAGGPEAVEAHQAIITADLCAPRSTFVLESLWGLTPETQTPATPETVTKTGTANTLVNHETYAFVLPHKADTIMNVMENGTPNPSFTTVEYGGRTAVLGARGAEIVVEYTYTPIEETTYKMGQNTCRAWRKWTITETRASGVNATSQAHTIAINLPAAMAQSPLRLAFTPCESEPIPIKIVSQRGAEWALSLTRV